MKKPVIGITLDSRGIGGYSERYPWYALRKNYTSVIVEAGGLPLALPHHVNQVEAYAHLIDGLLITGGAVDVDPQMYGETNLFPSVTLNHERTVFEVEMAKAMASLQKPCLGICGGMQVMNVARGGSLYQDIPTQLPQAACHVQETDRHQPCHTVTILTGTQLDGIGLQKSRIDVNSVHHQSVKEVGHGLIVNATADDGIVEGIEDPTHPFFMGIQWHPEFHVSSLDKGLFERFIAQCQVK